MSKTKQLITLIQSGDYRINKLGSLEKWVATRNEWATIHSFRSDVIARAEMHFYRIAKAGSAA